MDSFVPFELQEVSLFDPLRRMPNSVSKSWAQSLGNPGITITEAGATIVPSQVLGDTASILLTAEEFLALAPRFFKVPCKVEEQDKEIPTAAQRRPTKERGSVIQISMKDTSQTPIGHLNTISTFVFGATCDKNGIHLDENSLVCLCDGAGRTLANIMELNEVFGNLKEHVAVQNKHVFQVNFDLSGGRLKALLEFLLHNRDAKRTTCGTVQVVETAVIPHLDDAINYENKLWVSWVLEKLYKRSKISGTIIELLPWSMEGYKSTHSVFRGKGKSQNLHTAMRKLEMYLRNSGITVKQLPAVLDFALECFYQECPNAVADAHDYYERPKYHSRYKLHTTLAMKVMVWMIAKVYPVTGLDCTKFNAKVSQLIDTHFRFNRARYMNRETGKNTSKKMNLDRFWQECVFFNDPVLFNSGEGNTTALLRELDDSATKVFAK